MCFFVEGVGCGGPRGGRAVVPEAGVKALSVLDYSSFRMGRRPVGRRVSTCGPGGSLVTDGSRFLFVAGGVACVVRGVTTVAPAPAADKVGFSSGGLVRSRCSGSIGFVGKTAGGPVPGIVEGFGGGSKAICMGWYSCAGRFVFLSVCFCLARFCCVSAVDCGSVLLCDDRGFGVGVF